MKSPRLLAVVAVLSATLVFWGCGAFRETHPARSASEQLLISGAVDAALVNMPGDWMEGRVIYLETAHLDAYDAEYLVQKLRNTVLANGGRLTSEREEAEVILEVASGGLSTDEGRWLLGVPETPVPIPFMDALRIPELPLFKMVTHAGKAKLIATAVDPDSGASYAELPVFYGRVRHRYWWALLVGPFTWSDLPREIR